MELSGLFTVLPDVVFRFTGGVAVRATWAITEGGVPSSCEAVGGDTVTLQFERRPIPEDPHIFAYSCPAGLGQFLEAAVLHPDIYDVTVTCGTFTSGRASSRWGRSPSGWT